jgi:hypothetical protein
MMHGTQNIKKNRKRFLSGYTLRVVCIEQLSKNYVVIAMTQIGMRNEKIAITREKKCPKSLNKS